MKFSMVCYTCKAHEDSQSEDDLKGVAWHVHRGFFEGDGCVVRRSTALTMAGVMF